MKKICFCCCRILHTQVNISEYCRSGGSILRRLKIKWNLQSNSNFNVFLEIHVPELLPTMHCWLCNTFFGFPILFFRTIVARFFRHFPPTFLGHFPRIFIDTCHHICHSIKNEKVKVCHGKVNTVIIWDQSNLVQFEATIWTKHTIFWEWNKRKIVV